MHEGLVDGLDLDVSINLLVVLWDLVDYGAIRHVVYNVTLLIEKSLNFEFCHVLNFTIFNLPIVQKAQE